MDIFTTVLTRVVPIPIKPANLKVKALLKEARTGKLKADPDHLENHDYYFGYNEKNQKESKGEDTVASDHVDASNTELVNKNHEGSHESDNESDSKSDSAVTKSDGGIKHLDLYV